MESMVGMLLALYGIVATKAIFFPVDAVANLNKKTVDEVFVTPSFRTFSHRGQVLHGSSAMSRM